MINSSRPVIDAKLEVFGVLKAHALSAFARARCESRSRSLGLKTTIRTVLRRFKDLRSRTPNARSALPLHLFYRFTPVARVEVCSQLRTCENRSMSEFGGKAENICSH